MKSWNLTKGLLALFLLCAGVLDAKVYTIDFNRGTVAGTSLKTSVTGVSPAYFCSEGSEFFTLHTNTRYSFYNDKGCGIRIGRETGSGEVPFVITLSEEIQSKAITKIVVCASRGTSDESGTLTVSAGNVATQTFSFADMKDYETAFPESSTYILPEIKTGSQFKMIQVAARNTNFVVLHRIDIYTSDGDSQDAILSPKDFADEMGVFCNIAGQRISKPLQGGIYIRGGKKILVK